MSRVSLRVVPAATLAALAFAACTDAPVQPDAAGPAPNVARAAQAPERVAPGEVILQLKAGATLDDVLRPHGASKKADGYQGRFVVARTTVGNERALAALLARDARVEFAEPNYIRTVDAIDSRLWAFYNPGGLAIYFTRGGSRGQPVSSFISTPDADQDAAGLDITPANYGAASGTVRVGSIDTGVQFSHAEFSGLTLIAGADLSSPSAAPFH